MVMPLGPGTFYGGNLPRPWIYDDVNFNSVRVDSPSLPSAPHLAWASETHWSMGDLSSKRKRMQGKIEGSIRKRRAIEEDEDEGLTLSGGFKGSKPSFSHATVVDEGIGRSGIEINEKPFEKGSPGVRTYAKKTVRRAISFDNVQKSDQSSSGLDIPCTIYMDMRLETIDSHRTRLCGQIFRTKNLFSDQNDWANGHYTEGTELINPFLEVVCQTAENCVCLQGGLWELIIDTLVRVFATTTTTDIV